MSDATGATSDAPRSTSRNRSSVSNAADRQSGPATPAQRVTSADIEPILSEASHIARLWDVPVELTQSHAADTSEPVAGEPKAATPQQAKPSTSSSEPSSDSEAVWVTPADILELAAQANVLATQILNGEADIAIARAYASVARSIAALLKAEIEQRRFVGGERITLPNGRVHR